MSITTFLYKSSQFVLDFVFPPHCVNCKATNDWLCSACLSQVSFISNPICQHCGRPVSLEAVGGCSPCRDNPLQAIDGIRAVARFEDTPIRRAIHFLKYHNHQALATTLGKLLVEAYHRYQLELDVIVPVPLHPRRYKERGYNQSELLGRALAQDLELPLYYQGVQRIRHTEAQVNLDTEARRKNVIGAFACKNRELENSRVLLVDDVCTTGSTLDACATALKIAGVASVWGLTLAR